LSDEEIVTYAKRAVAAEVGIPCGGDAPAKEAEGKARAALADAERRAEVGRLRVTAARQGLEQAIGAALEAWSSALRKGATRLDGAALKALEALADAERQRGIVRQSLRWVELRRQGSAKARPLSGEYLPRTMTGLVFNPQTRSPPRGRGCRLRTRRGPGPHERAGGGVLGGFLAVRKPPNSRGLRVQPEELPPLQSVTAARHPRRARSCQPASAVALGNDGAQSGLILVPDSRLDDGADLVGADRVQRAELTHRVAEPYERGVPSRRELLPQSVDVGVSAHQVRPWCGREYFLARTA
jgi:hypothetical protein